MTDCDSCVVRNRAICSALSSEELAMLGRLAADRFEGTDTGLGRR